MVPLLQAFGFDVILIETVGSGQGDTAVRALADVVVLLLQPETGDDLQWEKAGVLEVADVVVIHKADCPERSRRRPKFAPPSIYPAGQKFPCCGQATKTGEGLSSLWDTIRGCPSRRGQNNALASYCRLAQERLAASFAFARRRKSQACEDLDRWREGRLPAKEAGAAVLALLANRQG